MADALGAQGQGLFPAATTTNLFEYESGRVSILVSLSSHFARGKLGFPALGHFVQAYYAEEEGPLLHSTRLPRGK